MVGGLEAEVPAMMVMGFCIVTGIVIWTMVRLYRGKEAKNGLAWFIAQWVLTAGAFLLLLRLLNGPMVPGAMASEENSLVLACCGLCWGGSILCMTLGLQALGKRK